MKQTDYMVLVNQLNALPEDWYETLDIVRTKNRYKEELELEKETCLAYRKLQGNLEQDGIYIELESALRSIAVQQEIMDEFTAEYGAAYAEKTVAPPGYSEHHTGLSLDLFLIVDGKDSRKNEDLILHPEIWETVHARLAEHGFILRYPEGKEHITGYGYEPWHIRYVNDPVIAEEIMRRGITLEEYLGAAEESLTVLEHWSSDLYSKDELNDAEVQIKCRFAREKDRRLLKLRYGGDEYNSMDVVRKYNAAQSLSVYTGTAVFFTAAVRRSDHSLEPEIPWVLGKTDRDGWDILGYGQDSFQELFSGR